MRFRYEYDDKQAGIQKPWYVGFSWFEYARFVTICYVIPFNWLIRWARDALFFVRRGPQYRAALERAAIAYQDFRRERDARLEAIERIPQIRADEYWRGFRDGKLQAIQPRDAALLALERAKQTKS